ncbi:type VI secretion system Vgr family protein, partial [Pseudomonas aeruginosa]
MRQRDLKFTFVVGEGKLAFDVVEFELEEALCEPFRLNLKLASDKNAIDFKQVLDQPGTFTLWQDGRPARYVHGIISHFTQGSSGFRRTRYELLLEPQLARLELCCNWRIFQEKSVPEILQALLKEHRVLDYEQRIYHEHLPREYCVQAGDSDHYLHDRLAFEEGLVYYFRFDEHRHTLVCSDRLYVQERIAGGPVLFSAQPEGDNPQPVLHSFRYSENVRTARQTQRDYSFKCPTYDQEHHLAGEALEHQGSSYERYDYPGRYKRSGAGRPFTESRLRGHRRDARVASVSGDDPRLIPGHAFALEGHPRADFNAWWRPVRVVHRGTQYAGQEEESADAPLGVSYDLRAKLVPEDVEWRPAPLPRPRIDGPQIATVVG